MPNFRKPKAVAAHAIAQFDAVGTPRHGNKKDGKIHSFRTSKNYQQAIKTFIDWLIFNGVFGGISCADRELATAFLHERAELIVQSHLDVDRRALEIVLSTKIDRVLSTVASSSETKTYTSQQIEMIAKHQNKKNGFSTRFAASTFVRAHELLTLREVSQRPPSTHRSWSEKRFTGLDAFTCMTTRGKGGLVREIAVPRSLYAELLTFALGKPKKVFDRNIPYISYFNIGGGKSWSQSFSSTSSRILGWSTGAHSLRHVGARTRMETLQMLGFNYFDARKIISEELGHFRGSITEVYL